MNHIARQSTIVKVGTNNLDASSTTEVANMNNIRKNNTGRETTIATKVNSVTIFLMAYNTAAFFKYNHLTNTKSATDFVIEISCALYFSANLLYKFSFFFMSVNL